MRRRVDQSGALRKVCRKTLSASVQSSKCKVQSAKFAGATAAGMERNAIVTDDMKAVWDISPPVSPETPPFPGDTAYAQRWAAQIGPGCPVNVCAITMS